VEYHAAGENYVVVREARALVKMTAASVTILFVRQHFSVATRA